jgi:p21-activated kinase 1
MAAATSPPPRPSRANTATLNDLYPSTHTHAHAHSQPQTPNQDRQLRRLSAPSAQQDSYFNDIHTQDASPDYPLSASHIHHHQGTRSRSGTTSGTSKFSNQTSSSQKKGGMLSFMSFMSNNKRLEISTPYDPVHLTHVGFNASTGEFTGLPREWQQLLQDSGISKQDQERHPKEVMEIVKFYQGQANENSVWEKMGKLKSLPSGAAGYEEGFQNPVR